LEYKRKYIAKYIITGIKNTKTLIDTF